MMQAFFSFIKKRSKLRHPKTSIIMYWVPALMKNSNNHKVKLKFHLFWLIKNALFKLLIDSFQQKLLKLWCQASQDTEDKQLSIFESIRICIQQFWPFRFSNSSEEESRIRPLLFKAKIFVALNIWQDYISEISIKEVAILLIVLIKFTSLLKTHFSFAVVAVWIPETRTSSSSSSALSSASPPSVPQPILRTNLNASPIDAFFASPSNLEAGKLATLLIGGWRIVAATLKTSCNEISFSFIKFKFKFDVLSLLSTSLVDAFVLMGGKFQKFSSPNVPEIYIEPKTKTRSIVCRSTFSQSLLHKISLFLSFS